MLILVLLVVTALGFDFTNGFHDTGNAMATSIATGALDAKPMITHRMSLSEMEQGYDTFLRPGETGAVKVVLSA